MNLNFQLSVCQDMRKFVEHTLMYFNYVNKGIQFKFQADGCMHLWYDGWQSIWSECKNVQKFAKMLFHPNIRQNDHANKISFGQMLKTKWTKSCPLTIGPVEYSTTMTQKYVIHIDDMF